MRKRCADTADSGHIGLLMSRATVCSATRIIVAACYAKHIDLIMVLRICMQGSIQVRASRSGRALNLKDAFPTPLASFVHFRIHLRPYPTVGAGTAVDM